MEDKILRKLFLGFIQIHILHHAKEEPGTLYPILHNMEANGLLHKEEKIVEGKVRKYYSITDRGNGVLHEARNKAYVHISLDIDKKEEGENRDEQ